MEDEVMIIARIDRKKKIRLFHLLLDERTTFSEWLRKQIDDCLEAKEKPKKRRRR